MAATRRMKACASSMAFGLGAGMASNARAAASRSALVAGASRPGCKTDVNDAMWSWPTA